MAIRNELKKLNRDDLDAFILDHFRHVYRDVSPLMYNEDKINLLLRNIEDEASVIDAFYTWVETRPGRGLNRLLILLPSPQDSVPSEAAAEVNAIRDALQRSRRGQSLEIHERSFVTVDSLRDAIAELRPHALHIATHGRPGALEIQNRDGRSVALEPSDLLDIVRQGSDPSRRGNPLLRLVTLAVCLSDTYAVSLASSFDCVIGMKGAIAVTTVMVFDECFYKSLGDGDSVALAFEKARTSVGVHDATLQSEPKLCQRISTIAERSYLTKQRG